MRFEMSNWRTAGVLASVVMPSRIPPRRGMANTWLGRRIVTFEMRDGARITCRLQDAGDVISVYLDGDYASFPVKWAKLRTIIDVGATTGCFSLWASRRAPQARIISIEPNPAIYSFLVRNVAQNELGAETRPIALGAARGFAEVVDRDFSTLATAVPTTAPTGVEMLTLEEVMDETNIGWCDLLKIDIEGGEYDVLLSAPLMRIGTIICEFHPVVGRSLSVVVSKLEAEGFTTEVTGGPIGFIFAERKAGRS
jgi:FkbM family methyltransferase